MFELKPRDGRQDSFKQNASLAHFSVSHNIPYVSFIAYVSSVSKRIIGRKLERKQNIILFLPSSQLARRACVETLATQSVSFIS